MKQGIYWEKKQVMTRRRTLWDERLSRINVQTSQDKKKGYKILSPQKTGAQQCKRSRHSLQCSSGQVTVWCAGCLVTPQGPRCCTPVGFTTEAVVRDSRDICWSPSPFASVYPSNQSAQMTVFQSTQLSVKVFKEKAAFIDFDETFTLASITSWPLLPGCICQNDCWHYSLSSWGFSAPSLQAELKGQQ